MSAKRVMVVEDATMMRLVIRNLLNDDPNLQVVANCKNGQEALDMLQEVDPDLIILDIEMPEMDGITFLRHARLKSRAKILVLSAVTTSGSGKAAKARVLGADAVIATPSGSVSFDLAEKRGTVLFTTIYKLLGLTRPA